MNILVLGAGMYVTGRNNSGTGTILSALAQYAKTETVKNVTVVSKSPASEKAVSKAVKRINKLIKGRLRVQFATIGNNPGKTLQALHKKYAFQAAIISLPDHLHFEFGKLTIESGIHTLMVKPLTPTLKEANALTKLADSKNVFTCVEFHKRYDETNLWVRRALQENKIGKLNYFTVDYSQRIDIPLKTFRGWSDKTNIFQYLGVHYVDLIYFLTGAMPQQIAAKGTWGILKENGLNTFDSTHCFIEWKSRNGDEFVSIHNTNWIDPNCSSALSDQKYKVVGTQGRIECDQKNRGLELVSPATGIQQINPYFSDFLPDENGSLKFSGYGYSSISAFLNDVKRIETNKVSLTELNEIRPSFKQALVSSAVIEAANTSMMIGGKWTNIAL